MDPRRRVSRAQERDAARNLGAKQHKGSGSGARRQDMHTDKALVECKTVLEGNKQITITDKAWTQLRYFAAVQDVVPMMHIRLAGKDYLMVPQEYYPE